MPRTAVLSNFDSYLASEYPPTTAGAAEAIEEELRDRQQRLAQFPYAVVLQVAFPELDYANRWCWQQFGPADGVCLEKYSEYPSCRFEGAHSHKGNWLTHWLVKTDYDFGYNEWCFSQANDRDRFLAVFPDINRGERWAGESGDA